MASLGVPYFFESLGIMDLAKEKMGRPSICSFCARLKRGMLYACAEREKYNVLALGQHADDLAESFFMSFLHNGLLGTMKAHYVAKEHPVRIIRPLIYVRESSTRGYAENGGLPVITDNCPACFEEPKVVWSILFLSLRGGGGFFFSLLLLFWFYSLSK